MTVSTETVRMAKSRPRKNQSERSDLTCHIIIVFITLRCSVKFFDKRGYPASVIQAGHHRAQQINRQSALQTSQRENNDRIQFTLTTMQ